MTTRAHTLLFLEPGHFHAALLLKRTSPRIAPDVHVYAAPGDERESFVDLVQSFNDRAEEPTAWRVHVHEARDAADALETLIGERRAEVVVLAGRNGGKLAAIERLHREGFWVLADKPWITTRDSLAHLDAACRGAPLAMDVMPDRHELLARLRKRVVDTPGLFGTLTQGDSGEPAIELRSTHHLCKLVDGRPLRRPAWYYDVDVQGDGMVDVQSHLTDQAQWLIGEDRVYDFDRDVVVEAARRWDTPVPLALFRDSTGAARWPRALGRRVHDDVLGYACNGEIRYRLCGVHVRQIALWGQREPAGGGDLHGAVVRGTRAVLEVRHGADTGFVPQVHLRPRPGVALERALADALASWRDALPGLGVEHDGNGYRFVAPAALHSTHESHFSLALGGFLDCVDAGRWPADLQPRIRTRYRLLAEARAVALAGDDAAP